MQRRSAAHSSYAAVNKADKLQPHDGPVRALLYRVRRLQEAPSMVLAVAALLLQFQSFPPPAQAVGPQMPVIHAASVNSFGSFKESAPVSTHPPVAVEENFIASSTESSSTHMNLDEVHLVSADSKSQLSSSLK